MSVETLAAVLHHSRAKGTAKLVLVGIANHDGDGGAYPSVATLARYANCEPRSVQRSIDKLVSLGELVVYVQQGGGLSMPDHSRPNRYDVLVSCPVWCDRTTQHRDTRETKQANLRGLPSVIHRGVTRVSPGDASVTGGVTPVSPGGVTPVSPKPSLEPTPNEVGTQVKDAGAMCSECSQPEPVCLSRQARLIPEHRHDYDPVVLDAQR